MANVNKEYTPEQLEVIKRLIQSGEASPTTVMGFGYLLQHGEKLDRAKNRTENENKGEM
ncbi:MAG: hypothetical protein K0S61_2556 [Anaerocolumna sp.]|jgi:hypothetical protein|nr:hypothetical protein [Anaerocolumna sp.]